MSTHTPSIKTPDLPPTAVIAAHGDVLHLVLPSGAAIILDATTLWMHCPSALRRRQRLDGRVPAPPAGLRIVKAAAMGNYALNIGFSDGHDRGVYPWALLADLARKPKLADFLIPALDAGIAVHAGH